MAPIHICSAQLSRTSSNRRTEETNVREAKTNLSRILEQVERIIIARAGKPIDELIPHASSEVKRGTFAGPVTVPNDALAWPVADIESVFHAVIILLNTNRSLWVLADDGWVGPSTFASFAAASAAYSSPISLVQVCFKSMLGKIDVQDGLVEAVSAAGISELPFLNEHAETLLAFPELHGHDPFDRMLLAQASASGILLITSARVLLRAAPSHTCDATV